MQIHNFTPFSFLRIPFNSQNFFNEERSLSLPRIIFLAFDDLCIAIMVIVSLEAYAFVRAFINRLLHWRCNYSLNESDCNRGWRRDGGVACIRTNLIYLDALYLSAVVCGSSVHNDCNVFGDLFLDRSEIIFRSGLPTGILTLTYVYVPTFSWIPGR